MMSGWADGTGPLTAVEEINRGQNSKVRIMMTRTLCRNIRDKATGNAVGHGAAGHCP